MKGQEKWRRDVSGHILWGKQTFSLSTALKQNQNLVAPIYYLKCLVSKKKYETCKETGKHDPYTGKKIKKADNKTTCESDQMLDLTGKTQSSLYKYVQRIKETIGLP